MTTEAQQPTDAKDDRDIPPEAPPAPAVAPVVGARRTIALFVVLLGMLLDLLDVVIVNVALPSIQRGIGADAAAVQWMVASYTLAFAVSLITSGRLGDIIGRKRMFLIGATGFAITSLAAGLAVAPEQLVAARFLQGLMAAAMVPQVLSIIQVLYRPEERGNAYAGLSVVFALGTVGGPIVGALLTSADVAGWGWRTIFLINVPVCAVIIAVAMAVVPESRGEHVRRLDIPAVALATAGLLLLVYPLVQGREAGWPAWTWISLAGSAVLILALVVYQLRRTESPLIPMSLFRHQSFNGGLLVMLFFIAGVMPFFLINTLFLQIGLDYSVIEAGLTGIVWGFAPPLFTAISAKYLTPRIGRLGLQLGLLLMIVGMFLLIGAVHMFDNVNTLHLAPGLAIGGTGMGLTFAPLLIYALNDVPVNDAGSASGIFNTVQQVGTAIGVAACGLVFFWLLASSAPNAVDSAVSGLRSDLVSAGASTQQADTVERRFRSCFQERMRVALPVDDVAECATADVSGQSPALTKTTAVHAANATRDGYRQTMERVLLYQVALFALAILASFWLPRRV